MFTPQLPMYYMQQQNRRSRLVQMPEATTVSVLRKMVFFKISQNSLETSVPEETPVNFAKFLRTPFLQSNSGRLLLKADTAITKREIQIVFIVKSQIQCLLLRLLLPRARGKNLTIQFLWASSQLLVTRISLIYPYLIDEFFFWFLVQLNEARRLGEYKVLSFCFWC